VSTVTSTVGTASAASSEAVVTTSPRSQQTFTDGTDATASERVYYSLTVLTTTGFGDFTAAQPLGRALAVLEMLVGQLYLVTVIGVLVGSLAQRRAA